MRYKLTSAHELRESNTGKARLLEAQTNRDVINMWVPVESSELCTHGKWKVDDW